MADFYAIAQAIATRFNSSNVSAPSGLQNIRESTCELPDAIKVEPTVLVFPPEGEFSFTGGARHGDVDFPVRFYLGLIRSNSRNAVLLLKWLGSLYDQFSGNTDLDLGSYVAMTSIPSMQVARLTYAGQEYEGIDLIFRVRIAEGLSPTQ